MNVAAGQKLLHHRFQVEHGGTVDRIQFTDEQHVGLHANDPANGAADAVGAILAPLRKDTNGRPRRIVARMTCREHDFRCWDLVKQEKHLDMRKIRKSLQCLRGKWIRQRNAGLFATPIVILSLQARCLNESDGLYVVGHRDYLTMHGKFPPWEPGR